MSAVIRDSLPHLRDMQDDDVPAVLEIEKSAYEFPWTEGVFRDCLRYRNICRVYETGQGIMGYGVLSVAAAECHMLNICIAPAYQNRGYGSLLVAQLLHEARKAGARAAILEVRVSNAAAFRLYHKLGFNEIGMRKRYYPAHGGREDALVLAREL